MIEGGGYNYVVGGDFHWRPSDDDVVNGQYLYSFTQNPDRPDLYPGWLGQKQSGFGMTAEWMPLDATTGTGTSSYEDFADGLPGRRRLRAAGRIPRGDRRALGYRFYPTGFFSRLRPLAGAQLRDRPRRRSDLAHGTFRGSRSRRSGACAARSTTTSRPSRSTGQTLEFDRVVWRSPGLAVALPAAHHVRRATTASSRTSPTCASERAATLLDDGDDPADGPPRARPHRRAAVDRRDRRRTRGPPLHRRRRPRRRRSTSSTPACSSASIGQYVETTRDPVALDRSPSSRRRPSSPGRPCFSYKLNWQTRALRRLRRQPRAVRRERGRLCGPRTASSSSRSPTRSSSDRSAVPEREGPFEPRGKGPVARSGMTCHQNFRSSGLLLATNADERAHPRGSLLASAALARSWPRPRRPSPQRPPSSDAAVPRTPTPRPATWKEVDRSSRSRSSRRRRGKVDAILQRGQAAQGRGGVDASALIRSVQLRTGLHGYETAVRFLKERAVARRASSRATTLELFYAQALVHYAQAYSWEIAQRERVESTGAGRPEGLDARADLRARPSARTCALWQRREALGDDSRRTPLRVHRAEQLPDRHPRHAARRRRRISSSSCSPNSSFWTPEQSNDVYRARPRARCSRRTAATRMRAWRIRSAHPARAASSRFSADLEALARGRGRARGGARGAARARCGGCTAIFTEDDDRAGDPSGPRGAPAALPRRRRGGRWEWRSSRSSGRPRTRPTTSSAPAKAAQEGRDAYPDSPGGAAMPGPSSRRSRRPTTSSRAMSSDGSGPPLDPGHAQEPLGASTSAPTRCDLEQRIGSRDRLQPACRRETRFASSCDSSRPAAAWKAAAAGDAGLQAAPDVRHAADDAARASTSSSPRRARTSPRADNRLSSAAILLRRPRPADPPGAVGRRRRAWSPETTGGPSADAEVWLYALRLGHRAAAPHASSRRGRTRTGSPGSSTRRRARSAPTSWSARRGQDYALDPSFLSLIEPREPAGRRPRR